jgi:hypothetical protein
MAATVKGTGGTTVKPLNLKIQMQTEANQGNEDKFLMYQDQSHRTVTGKARRSSLLGSLEFVSIGVHSQFTSAWICNERSMKPAAKRPLASMSVLIP